MEKNARIKEFEKPAYKSKGDDDNNDPHVDDMKPKKNIDPYEHAYAMQTQFFSTYHPDFIEKTFLNHLSSRNINAKVKDDRYKIKFEIMVKTATVDPESDGNLFHKPADEMIEHLTKMMF